MEDTVKQQNQATTLDEILSANLQHLMQARHLTEAELSRQARIPQPTVHKILTGKTDDPRISTLQTLANFFGVSVDELYTFHSEISGKKPNIATQPIPIISWSNCLTAKQFISDLTANNWDQWAVTENLGTHLYGLKTKPSMEPRFTENSMLVIDPSIAPLDGDIVVVHYPDTTEATLRRILIDGPRKVLTLLNENEEGAGEFFRETIKILGVVIQVRLDF